MSNLDYLNHLCTTHNVQAAYYDQLTDFAILMVERILNTTSIYTDPLEQEIYIRFPYFMAHLTDTLKSLSSPIVYSHFPLMNPVHVFLVVTIYLLLILIGLSLSNFIPTFKLKSFSLFHNFFMVIISAYICISVTLQTIHDRYVLFGNPIDHTANGIPMAKIVWLFYLSKIPEFVDTMIMLLKKNHRQISFLHVYHHTSIFIVMWLVTLFGPGGDTYFSTMLNTFIHVLMYGYYFFSSLKFTFINSLKKYLTIMQILQFALNFIQASFNVLDYYFFRPQKHSQGKGYPHYLSCLLVVYMISMLALFYNFYIMDRRRANKLKVKKVK